GGNQCPVFCGPKKKTSDLLRASVMQWPTTLCALAPFCSEAACQSVTRPRASMTRGNGTVSSGRKWRILGLPPGRITRCALIAFARPHSCLAGCRHKTPHLATLGVGTAKTGRNLTIVDRQPVQATLWSLIPRVAARCFLVGERRLESSTTPGSGTA